MLARLVCCPDMGGSPWSLDPASEACEASWAQSHAGHAPENMLSAQTGSVEVIEVKM